MCKVNSVHHVKEKMSSELLAFRCSLASVKLVYAVIAPAKAEIARQKSLT
jgi:hypothetical protein